MKKYFYSLIIIISYGCENSVKEDNSYDYSIEQKLDCWCPGGGEWVKLFVKADTIANVIMLSNSTHLSYEDWSRYKTINGLFDVITKIDTAHFNITVTIDSIANYPSHISFGPKSYTQGDTALYIEDAQISYTTKNYIKL